MNGRAGCPEGHGGIARARAEAWTSQPEHSETALLWLTAALCSEPHWLGCWVPEQMMGLDF